MRRAPELQYCKAGVGVFIGECLGGCFERGDFVRIDHMGSHLYSFDQWAPVDEEVVFISAGLFASGCLALEMVIWPVA